MSMSTLTAIWPTLIFFLKWMAVVPCLIIISYAIPQPILVPLEPHLWWRNVEGVGVRGVISRAVRKVQSSLFALFETYLYFLYFFGIFRVVIKANFPVLVHTVAAWKKRLPMVKKCRSCRTLSLLNTLQTSQRRSSIRTLALRRYKKLPTRPIMAFLSLCWVRVPSTG